MQKEDIMFRFIHTYTEESFPGLAAKGLWREGDGLKLMHTNYLPAERSFNEIAKIGGLLHQRLSELQCPFYIDRYQGGIPFPYKYEYDKELLNHYREQLGENFWGFQIHEWASNYEGENCRVMEAKQRWLKEHGSLAGMWEYYREAVKTDPMALFVEAWSVDEWAQKEHPADVEAFVRDLYMLWEKRAEETGCALIPADSAYLAPKIELQFGAKLLLPEIGWQIEGTRAQVAYTRGMAKAAGVPWGVYYECWGLVQDGPDELTIPYAANTADNEWTETELRDDIIRRTSGHTENGGSSRSLQERCWVYAYFSGAQVIGEEYGVCNTFRNYTDYELSEYGLVKKRFLDFTTNHPDLGKTYTPIAIAIPAEMPIWALEGSVTSYIGFPLAQMKGDFAEKVKYSRRMVRQLLYKYRPGYDTKGHDAHCMMNGAFPDVFDMIHGDMEDALKEYEYIIDLTGDPVFAASHDNIVALDELDNCLKAVLPCSFSEEVHAVYNRTATGWNVLVMNNQGIERSAINGEYGLKEFSIQANVAMQRSTTEIEKLEGNGKLIRKNNGYTVVLDAGQWLILTIK